MAFRRLLKRFLFKQSYTDIIYWHHPASSPCGGCATKANVKIYWQADWLIDWIGNERVPKIIVNGSIFFFLNNNRHFGTIRYDTRCYFNVRLKADISQLNLPHGQFQAITVSDCCLIKLLPCILFGKYVYISAVEMATRGNRQCASGNFRSLSTPVIWGLP